MELVAHRVNRLEDLEALDPGVGAEIDLRSRGGRIILQHEAHADGPGLDAFLEAYARTRRDRLLILNPKEEGLDPEARRLLDSLGIERYFFLDLAFPSVVRLALRESERRVALRVSEYEPMEAALALAGRVEWVWLDCFSGNPPSLELARRLKASFRVCLVSPELEGHPAESIPRFRPLSAAADAVCTKRLDLWRY